jgi:hypothetical protein
MSNIKSNKIMTKLEMKLGRRKIMLEERKEQILNDIKGRAILTADMIIHEAAILEKIDIQIRELERMLAL